MTDDGDPQETVDLIGDDGVLGRMVIPRVWHLPSQPAHGIRLRDMAGVVWQRPAGDPTWLDMWHAPNMNPQRWNELLTRGPLTEVL